jgi:hypothetical protein
MIGEYLKFHRAVALGVVILGIVKPRISHIIMPTVPPLCFSAQDSAYGKIDPPPTLPLQNIGSFLSGLGR